VGLDESLRSLVSGQPIGHDGPINRGSLQYLLLIVFVDVYADITSILLERGGDDGEPRIFAWGALIDKLK
jgi:hypothetical protein